MRAHAGARPNAGQVSVALTANWKSTPIVEEARYPLRPVHA